MYRIIWNLFPKSFITLSMAIVLSACASVNPLPETLNIVPPSKEIPNDIAAFSGVWKGMWNGLLETYLVVEEINEQEAKIIIAIGVTPSTPEGSNMYVTTTILSGPTLEWTDPDGNKYTYKMEKSLNDIKALLEEKETGAQFWAYMKRDNK